MFEGRVRDLDHERIGRETISLDDDRSPFFFRLVEERPELFERNFLVAEINRGDRPACDADDLRIDLGTEGEARQRHRHRDARLQDEVRAKEEKKDQQKNDVQHRDDAEPAEMIFFRSGKLHGTCGLPADENLARFFHRRLEADDVTRRFAISQHVHHFDSGPFANSARALPPLAKSQCRLLRRACLRRKFRSGFD